MVHRNEILLEEDKTRLKPQAFNATNLPPGPSEGRSGRQRLVTIFFDELMCMGMEVKCIYMKGIVVFN